MPFSSTPSSAFNIMPSVRPQTSGVADSFRNNYKTPNLFDTIQAVRNNELDRQVKKAQLAKFLQDLQQAPIENEIKRAVLNKSLMEIDPNSFENKLKLADLENKVSALGLNEQKVMAASGMAPTSHNALLQMSPKNRRDVLGGRQQGSVTGKTYIKDPSLGKMIDTGAVDENGYPVYAPAKQVAFDNKVSMQNKKTSFDLRKEFQGIDVVKDYQIVKRQVSAMDALINSKNLDEKTKNSKLATDQGVITLFNKVTDPQSVVRESEYERTPSNLSLANRFSGALDKWRNGGAGLTENDRKSLLFGAKVIADSMGSQYNQLVDNYEGLAKEFGVKPSNVTSGFGRHKPFLEKNKTASSSFEIVGVRNE